MPKPVSLRGQAKRLSVHPTVFCLSSVCPPMCSNECVCLSVPVSMEYWDAQGGQAAICVSIQPFCLSVCPPRFLSVCLPACMPACLSREYWDAQGGQPEGAAKAHRQNKERTVIVDGYQVCLYVGWG